MHQTPAHPAIDPRALAETLRQSMNSLLAVIERETELARAGNIRDAIALEAEKTELSQRYVQAMTRLKGSEKTLAKSAPDLLASLRRQHETFRAMLQVNLTVLATAHAVSEGIVRGVNTEMQRRNMPQTYTAAGRAAAPNPRHAAPLAISRSL